MDTTTAKTLLMISSTKYDDYLDAVIPMFEEKVKQYANNRFEQDDGTEKLPPDLEQTLVKWIQHDMNNRAGLESRTMGDVSYNYSNEMPDFIRRDIAPHRKVSFK
ncbi:phage head-tail connector protein [Salibacterium lacus]|uniref:Phage head-tail connector protein n=1 Tax=Salibacterium lacus TaxID=1898109 RepID=A0ABW5SXN1_9BACI